MPYVVFLRATMLACLIVLVGCGGGGGDSTPPKPEPTPKLLGTPDTQVDENQSYSFTATAQNFSGTVTFSIENQPAWADFDTATGTLSGTPSFDDAGNYADIKISGASSGSSASLSTFAIEVVNVNRIPTLVSSDSLSVVEGTTLDTVITVEDPDGDTVALRLSGLPEFAVFKQENNTLLLAPTFEDAGEYSELKVLADDGFGEVEIGTLVATVADAIALKGKVIDGYIHNALVYIDVNNNEIFDDADEWFQRTDEGGNFQLIVETSRLPEIEKATINALLDAQSVDIDRPELNFSDIQLTLKSFIATINIEQGVQPASAISPFTNDVFELVREYNLLYLSGEMSRDVFLTKINEAKASIITGLVTQYNINISQENLTTEELTQIVFGDFIAQSGRLKQQISRESERRMDQTMSGFDTRDFDGDGTPNNIDTDDDGDGYLDTVDAFIYDATEWLDSDNDGTGDNADSYRLDANCHAQAHGNGESCYQSLLSSYDTYKATYTPEGQIYHLLASENKVVVTDIELTVVSVVELTDESPASLIKYLDKLGKVVVSFENGLISYIEESELVAATTLEYPAENLIETEEFFVVKNRTNGFLGIFNENWEIQNQSRQFNGYSSSSLTWNSTHRRLFSTSSGISPADIYAYQLDDQGEVISAQETPYHGDYSISPTLISSPDGQFVANGTGVVYKAEDLTFAYFLGARFNSGFWLDGHGLITIDTSVGDITKSHVTRFVERNRIAEVLEFEGEIVNSFQLSDSEILLFIKQNEQLITTIYRASDDTDGDGVDNTLDAFPNDVAASIDTDNDGFPDSWNEGYLHLDSNYLRLDDFPNDSSCWLMSLTEDGTCEATPTSTNIQNIKYSHDEQGILYSLNEDGDKVLRMSLTSGEYLAPLPLAKGLNRFNDLASQIVYVPGQSRVYVAYHSGRITYFNTSDPSREHHFSALSRSVQSLGAAGNFVVAQDSTGAWASHYSLASDGTISDREEWNHVFSQHTWDGVNDRFFYIGHGRLVAEAIDQESGEITSKSDYYHINLSGDYHVAVNENKVISRNGRVHEVGFDNVFVQLTTETNGFDLVHHLANTYIGVNVNHNENESTVNMYDDAGYEKVAQLSISGRIIDTLVHGNTLFALWFNEDYHLNATPISFNDTDQDGLPDWWEQTHELSAVDATDADSDADADGLTALEEYQYHTDPNNGDSDNDGLSDSDEINTHATDPLVSDSDSDGLSDGEEVYQYQSNPNLVDSDEDGLTDYQEALEYQSNPNSPDSDGDGIPDLVEVENQLDINSDDSTLDQDSDGLSNAQEYTLSTSIVLSDTDADGLLDGEEVNQRSTDPLNRDSDGDKILDSWEITHGFDPLAADGVLDADEDGFNNVKELLLGSDPNDDASAPSVSDWTTARASIKRDGYLDTSADLSLVSPRWQTSSSHYNSVGAMTAETMYWQRRNDRQRFEVVATRLYGQVDSWVFEAEPGESFEAPMVLVENKIVILLRVNQSKALVILDANTGAVDNRIAVSANVESFTAYAGNVYVSTSTGLVSQINMDSGEFGWQIDSANGCMLEGPLVDEQNLYTFADNITVVDRATGAVKQIIEREDTYQYCNRALLGKTGNIILEDNGEFTSYDLSTGQVIWTIEGQKIANGLGVVFINQGSSIVAVNEVTGEQLWTFDSASHNYVTSMAVINNVLLVSEQYRNAYALNSESGELTWSADIRGNIYLSPTGSLAIRNRDSNIIHLYDYLADADNDGMNDGWELTYGLNPDDSEDAVLDSDVDGLTNLEEFGLLSNPFAVDSDGDGLSDGDEVNTYQSNPIASDSDNDGIEDSWEVDNGFDLNNANDALVDTDNDGVLNIDEYRENTDPNDATSAPEVIVDTTYSFEDAQIPAEWSMLDEYSAVWGVSALDASDGQYSLFTNNDAGIEFTKFFAGNRLTFDYKLTCNWGRITVQVDDVDIASFATAAEWTNVEAVVPYGRHKLTFKANGCNSVSLDNIKFETLTSIDQTSAIYASLRNGQLFFVDENLETVRQVALEQPVIHNTGISFVQLADKRVVVPTNTSEKQLAFYDSSRAHWSYLNTEQVGVYTNSRNSLAQAGNYLVMLAQLSSQSRGLFRLHIDTLSQEFFSVGEYKHVNRYDDEHFIAVNNQSLELIDIESMDVVSSAPLTSTNVTGVAANDAGEVFLITSDGLINKYDASFVLVESINIIDFDGRPNDSTYLINLSISTQGDLIFNLNNHLVRVNSALNHLSAIGENSTSSVMTPLFVADGDNDGIPYWWEVKYGLDDENALDAIDDIDDDNLTNIQEYDLQTSPLVLDTDGDQLGDGEEVNTHMTNPVDVDSDNDNINDGDEVLNYGTDPLLADTDNDTFTDFQEIMQFNTDPLDENSIPESITALNIDFEDQLDSPFLSAVDGSNADWTIVQESLSDGSNYALKSGAIGDSQRSGVSISNIFVAGILSFNARVSSESCCDKLYVYLNDELQHVIVQSEPMTYELTLTSGLNDIRFEYRKDGSVSSNEDAAWIDDIVFVSN